MNSNLVREQRPDKHGKVVTRLVRASPLQSTVASKMPAPSVGVTSALKTTAFKPRPEQLEQKERKIVFSKFQNDDELRTNYNFNPWHWFTANDVEMYTVFGTVANPGNALKMLHEGVRTVEEARAYLQRHDAENFFIDRSDLTEAAIRKNLHPSDFLDYSAFIKEHHTGSDAVDGVLYSISSLAVNNSYDVQRDIFEGRVSYDHIKQIGTSKLKAIGRLGVMHKALVKLKSGEAKYTLEDVKELVDRVSAERLEPSYLENVITLMDLAGYDIVQRSPRLHRVSTALAVYRNMVWKNEHEEADLVDRVTYALEVTSRVLPDSENSVNTPDEFFDAGLPVEIAAEALRDELSFEEAKLRHEAISGHGVHRGLAEGWI